MYSILSFPRYKIIALEILRVKGVLWDSSRMRLMFGAEETALCIWDLTSFISVSALAKESLITLISCSLGYFSAHRTFSSESSSSEIPIRSASATSARERGSCEPFPSARFIVSWFPKAAGSARSLLISARFGGWASLCRQACGTRVVLG